MSRRKDPVGLAARSTTTENGATRLALAVQGFASKSEARSRCWRRRRAGVCYGSDGKFIMEIPDN